MAIDLRSAPVGTPVWWMVRLLHRLEMRARRIQVFDDYYNGKQPLAFASDKFRETFGDRFRAFSSNFMALVVDGTRERLEVTGFRFSDRKGDQDLWGIWQENDLDGHSQIALTEALIKGVAYTLVEPQGEATPRITVEDALDTIVEMDPRDHRRRLAGLKRWVDEDGRLVVYVYLPDLIFKYRSVKRWPDRIEGWPAQSMLEESVMPAGEVEQFVPDGEEWPLPNTLGRVPVVPLPNRPRLKGDGQSEIASVMSNQDAVNKYRADALIAAEFVAYPQRWALNLDVLHDPTTGQPISPFKGGAAHIWTVPPPDPADPNPAKVELGQFPQADLAPYQKMIEGEIGAIASISRIPYHFLLGQPQMVPPSGESIKSSEAPLVAKVTTAQIHFGEGWEETMRLALRAMHDERADLRTAETIWRDPETRSDGVRTDAVVKQFQAGLIDVETAQEQLGYSPEQIGRMRGKLEPPVQPSPDLVPAPTGPRMSATNG